MLLLACRGVGRLGCDLLVILRLHSSDCVLRRHYGLEISALKCVSIEKVVIVLLDCSEDGSRCGGRDVPEVLAKASTSTRDSLI